MKKNLTRLPAIVLVICMALSYIVPATFAEETATAPVVYNFDQAANDIYRKLTDVSVALQGGQLLMFNLDTWELVQKVETGIAYPTSVAVLKKEDGTAELYITGNNKLMFRYNPYTGESFTTSQYNSVTGLRRHHRVGINPAPFGKNKDPRKPLETQGFRAFMQFWKTPLQHLCNFFCNKNFDK